MFRLRTLRSQTRRYVTRAVDLLRVLSIYFAYRELARPIAQTALLSSRSSASMHHIAFSFSASRRFLEALPLACSPESTQFGRCTNVTSRSRPSYPSQTFQCPFLESSLAHIRTSRVD